VHQGLKWSYKSQRDGEYCSGGFQPTENREIIIEFHGNGAYFALVAKNMYRSHGTQLNAILFRRVETRRYNILRPSGTFKTI
jgi:hypothetical protein